MVSVFYFLGLVIPQQQIVPPEEFAAWRASSPLLVGVLQYLGLTSVYSSPLVTACTAAFFLNLIIVTWRRFPAALKALREPVRGEVSRATVTGRPFTETPATEAQVNLFLERLRGKGFQTARCGASFRAVKNRCSVLGSLFFHLSFLLFLVAGLTIFHTRFWGEAFVTEGQSFNGTRPEYRSIGRFSQLRTTLPDLHFLLEKMQPRFEKMEAVSLETSIRPGSEGRGPARSFDVNFPYREGAVTMLVIDAGAAPFMRVTDGSGRELFGAYVSLNVIRGREDFFRLPGTPYEFRVRFWPDFAVDRNGYLYTRSYHFNRPLFAVEVVKNGAVIASGRLKSPADAVTFDGLRLSYGDIRYYGRFLITEEKGGGLLAVGFLLAIAGLLFKFGWPRQEVVGLVEQGEEGLRLIASYRSEYCKGSGNGRLEPFLRDLRC